MWLPSGGSLVIDRTEAMVVVDVNTGKFVGKGGNLEETVTKNNLEAAEEIVRQLRLRDLGGIIVVDFIDMVLESNRELVLRRLIECLGRDRTKHQVAEVTSLGLVQMTRKRVGQGLLEAFSETCPECQGRGVIIHMDHGAPTVPDRGESPREGGNGSSGSNGAAGRDRAGRSKSRDRSRTGSGAAAGAACRRGRRAAAAAATPDRRHRSARGRAAHPDGDPRPAVPTKRRASRRRARVGGRRPAASSRPLGATRSSRSSRGVAAPGGLTRSTSDGAAVPDVAAAAATPDRLVTRSGADATAPMLGRPMLQAPMPGRCSGTMLERRRVRDERLPAPRRRRGGRGGRWQCRQRQQRQRGPGACTVRRRPTVRPTELLAQSASRSRQRWPPHRQHRRRRHQGSPSSTRGLAAGRSRSCGGDVMTRRGPGPTLRWDPAV